MNASRGDSDSVRFSALFRELSPRVYAYARRQCEAADAHDVVADTFAVAWRRFAEIPADPLPWLLVVARNLIANRRRSAQRQIRLATEVARAERRAPAAAAAEHHVVERAALFDAIERLTASEREALLLVAWDGLDSAGAAEVAGCTRRAFEARLSRARARLTRELADSDSTHSARTPRTRLGEAH